jgi:hypothetical protein
MPKGKVVAWWIVIQDENNIREDLLLDIPLEISDRVDNLIKENYETDWPEKGV